MKIFKNAFKESFSPVLSPRVLGYSGINLLEFTSDNQILDISLSMSIKEL